MDIYPRLSQVERTKRVKMNRAGGKKPAEAKIRPLLGLCQLEIKGSNIGSANNYLITAR